MELDFTNKPPVPDYTTFHQLCAEHLDQSPSALVNSPTQESITVLRDKVLDEPKPPSSATKMFAVVEQWNAAQPISKLPPELIAHIVALGLPITHYFEGMGPLHYMKALTSLATISRMWRNAIIRTPSLWVLLSTRLPHHINRISLERSGTCPLMADVSRRSPVLSSVDELLNIASPHRNRWSHARLEFVRLDRIMEYLTSPAPRLETFYLDPSLQPDLQTIDLFGGDAPRLQDLSISRVRVVFGSEVFRGLRKLSLCDIDVGGELISADQVLATLSASPELELLDVKNVEVGFTQRAPSSTRTPIQLSHLKKIRLVHVSSETVGNILPFIRAPNCTSFDVGDVWQEPNNPFNATDFLGRSFGHFDAFIRSTVAFNGSSWLFLYANGISWNCNGLKRHAPPYFRLEFDFEMNPIIPWISQFHESGPPRPALQLDLTSDLSAEHVTELKMLALLPNVQTLRTNLVQAPREIILDLLGDPNKDTGAHAFPGLKVLELGGTRERPLRDLEPMLIPQQIHASPGKKRDEFRPATTNAEGENIWSYPRSPLMDLTKKPPVPDYNMSHQLYADHLDQSPSALVNSPTQASITLLRDKVLDEPKLPSSAAKMFAVIDQWNAAQSISKLPLELIAHIASLRLPMIDYIGRIRQPRDYMKDLASLSVISRMWRNAIIGTPSLWALLSTHLPRHVNRIYLERSGTCPLMVVAVARMSSPNLSPDELLDIALPHRDRWLHVNLCFTPLARVMEYLTSPAPRLETLFLLVDRRTAADLEPIDLFRGYAPSLQDISIFGAPTELGSEVFRGLRRLNLRAIEGEVISPDQVLAILSASPGLEFLSIMETQIGFTRLAPSSTRTPIQLPHLKDITLDRLRTKAVGSILPFIRAPNCVSFRLLDVFHESDDPFDLTNLLEQSFDHFDAFIPSILVLHGSSELSLSSNCISWICTGQESDNTRSFYFKMHSETMNIIIPWISRFLGSEPPRPAHELNVTFKLQQVPDEVLAGLKTLGLLSNVQSFKIDYAEPATYLILSLLGDTNKDARMHAFPHLKELRLDRSYSRPLQELEAILKRRYGESGQSVTGPPPIRIVLVPPFCSALCGPSHTRLQFEELRRIRITHGVESVTLISPFGPEGMPACIYDDASDEYCNPL